MNVYITLVRTLSHCLRFWSRANYTCFQRPKGELCNFGKDAQSMMGKVAHAKRSGNDTEICGIYATDLKHATGHMSGHIKRTTS